LNSYGKNLVKLPKEVDGAPVPTATLDISASGARVSTSTTKKQQLTDKTDERLNPKDSNTTQSTVAASGSTSEDLFEVSIQQHKQHGAGTSAKSKACALSSPVPQVKTLPTESCGTPQGGCLSAVNAAPPSTKVSNIDSSVTSGKKKMSMGRRISGMFKA
jgi:hypothetical protein